MLPDLPPEVRFSELVLPLDPLGNPIVWDGIRRSEGTHEIEGYFLANRSLPWWAVGLSVMATQLSAITLIGTTGQGATDGLRFVQFYFGLPIAMAVWPTSSRGTWSANSVGSSVRERQPRLPPVSASCASE